MIYNDKQERLSNTFGISNNTIHLNRKNTSKMLPMVLDHLKPSMGEKMEEWTYKASNKNFTMIESLGKPSRY